MTLQGGRHVRDFDDDDFFNDGIERDSLRTEFESNATLKDLEDEEMPQNTKDRRKDLRATFKSEMKMMTSELDVVLERFGEDGLDALLTPGTNGKMNQTVQFSADA